MSHTQHALSTAGASAGFGKVVYRVIAVALGLVALLVVVFSFFLLLGKHTVDSAFYTLGSAAVGALGGVFAPHGGDSASPGTDIAVAKDGQGGPNNEALKKVADG